MSRRLMLRNESGATPILPPEYQQVEYIESNGNLYILSPLSGFGLKGHTVHCRIGRREAPSSYQVAFANRNLVADGSCLYITASGKFSFGSGTAANPPNNKLCEAVLNFENSSQSGTIDGLSIYHDRYKNYGTGSFYLFGAGAQRCFVGFFGRFQIYNTSTLEMKLDFVPCYRKADNVIGMYDLVTDTFITKTGTGTLTKGADVN